MHPILLEIEPILRPNPNLYEYWMFPVLLVVFIILAYVKIAYSKRFQRIFSSLVRLQILRQLMREELVFSHRATVLLFLNFVLIISLVIYTYINYAGWSVGEWKGQALYWLITGYVAAAYSLKLVGNYSLRILFNDKGLLKEYMYEVVLLNKVLGLILIPLVFGLIFLNIGSVQLLYMIFIFIVGASLLYRIIQGAIMCAGYTISGVYIILYLCTLEILPFALVYKAIALQVTG